MYAQLEFNKQQSVFTLPRWLWPIPGPYNGSTGAERVRGWQIVGFLRGNGWFQSASRCSVTGATASLVFHSEDYIAPWRPIAVTRGVHTRIHQRFRHPANWYRFLNSAAVPGCWAFELSCEPVPAVPRAADEYKAHISQHAPWPDWIVIPWPELFRDDEYVLGLADMAVEEIARFIASNTWTFARSLSHIPHEYVVKRRCSDPIAFERLVLWIRKVGVKRRFGQAHYIYLDFNGWSYWSMGNTLSATTILNRARVVIE